MQVSINREDVEDIKYFIQEGSLVQLMNEKGLSFGAMALVLTAIQNEIITVETTLGIEEEDDDDETKL